MIVKILQDNGNNFVAEKSPNIVFKDGKLFKITEMANTRVNQKRRKFWMILDYVLESGQYINIKTERLGELIKESDTYEVKKKKLYYIVRWWTNFTEVGYYNNGEQYSAVRSTSDGSITEEEFDTLILDTKEILGEYGIDLSEIEGDQDATGNSK